MGDNSRSKGRGFETQCHILDGDFSHWFVVKNCIVCLKRLKINEKEGGVGPIFYTARTKTFYLHGLGSLLLSSGYPPPFTKVLLGWTKMFFLAALAVALRTEHVITDWNLLWQVCPRRSLILFLPNLLTMYLTQLKVSVWIIFQYCYLLPSIKLLSKLPSKERRLTILECN